jgi:addiction module HigA family antidote
MPFLSFDSPRCVLCDATHYGTLIVNDDQASQHAGSFIRENVLPKGMTVSKAAEILGVGRPALSNLLNGKASLSSDMAGRVERAFGASAAELLARQARHDAFTRRDRVKELAVRSVVRPFLGIEARGISAWAERESARAELPALLRRLVNTTGRELSKVDFPAYDNAQRPGWDGLVEAGEATPWIPRGRSGWEFGCNSDPARKANEDFKARASTAPSDRKVTTFVFVTPHKWPGKNEWARVQAATGAWKDVRAFDASDLEQWLEQSGATQAWFAGVIGHTASGILSPEHYWARWAGGPVKLSPLLFQKAVAAITAEFTEWLSAPPRRPFVVTADSEGEAIAFIACTLEMVGEPAGKFGHSAVVVETTDALRRIAALGVDLITIVGSRDVEAASGDVPEKLHLVIARRRDSMTSNADFALDLVDGQTLRDALSEMGVPEHEIPRLARESGHSPTILRRRLSHIPEIRSPAWASDPAIAQRLIPFVFAGAWDADNKADQEIIRCLSDEDWATVEVTLAELSMLPDCPVWSIGKQRGVASKIDALFATAAMVTEKELDSFFTVAEIALSEIDPALDLPAEQRWAAGIYGKVREHSPLLRRSLYETLVLLAVHGDGLFRQRLGIFIGDRVDAMVRRLLMPLDGKTWLSQSDDLVMLAEAAPTVFLDIVEEDLSAGEPKLLALFGSGGDPLFGGCPRSGLLWAIEGLAWEPSRMPRTAMLLARLAEIPVTDNWSNTPYRSLAAIFRWWLPQTAAKAARLCDVMTAICERHPAVGWKLIVEQFSAGNTLGHPSHRPQWRNDAAGAGISPPTNDDCFVVRRKALDLALAWPEYNEILLADLIGEARSIPEEDQDKIWGLIRAWLADEPPDTARHRLRERLRTSVLSRQARIGGVSSRLREGSRETYEALAPVDLVIRHFWLFERTFLPFAAEELEGEEFDYTAREERINAMREAALGEILDTLGENGILRLCAMGQTSGLIGWTLANDLIPPDQMRDFLLRRLLTADETPSDASINSLISGFLGRLQPLARDELIATVIEALRSQNSAEATIRLLGCAPIGRETWRHLDRLPEEWRQRYWRQVGFFLPRPDRDEANMLVDRLLDVDRPRAAFRAIELWCGEIETKRLIRLLRAVGTVSAEPEEHYQLDGGSIYGALKTLRERVDCRSEDLAQLEFMFVPALVHRSKGLPGIELEMEKSPILLVRMIAFLYRRDDKGADPPEWTIDDDGRSRHAAERAYQVLRLIRRLPGTQRDGTIDAVALSRWVEATLRLGSEYGRAGSCERAVGEWLGRSAVDTDGNWPCRAVRDVIETVGSVTFAYAVGVGRLNARGVHIRSDGGDDERRLAAEYRAWAEAVAVTHPLTSRMLARMAGDYDRDAVWHDERENVRRRVGD